MPLVWTSTRPVSVITGYFQRSVFAVMSSCGARKLGLESRTEPPDLSIENRTCEACGTVPVPVIPSGGSEPDPPGSGW